MSGENLYEKRVRNVVCGNNELKRKERWSDTWKYGLECVIDGKICKVISMEIGR